MNTPPPQEVTQLLLAWSNGDKAALDRLIPLVHAELRRLAKICLRNERPGHTLQTSALELEPAARAAFLAEACAGDEELRREVESLLAYENETAGFIRKPAPEVVARELADEPVLSIRTIDHFQILSLLGRGGMGEVYLAQDTRLGRKVALKLLPAEFTADADRLRRFVKEAKAASALNHPNILTVHEIGQVDGAHYIVTEFIDGQTLRQRMQTTKLNLNEAVDVAIQVAQALEAAHSAGIVHRDIKPENVMIRRDGLVKALDFGLAKLIERQGDGGTGGRGEEEPTLALSPDRPVASSPRPPVGTDPGTVMGTASYMSPEQARGLKVDARTDIFSLGVALYEMIAGSPPFDGVNALDVISAILQKEPAPLSQTAAEAPPELEMIVSQALRKDREDRYQTAKDLLIGLKDFKGELAFAAKLESSGRADRKEPVTAQAEIIPTSHVFASPTTSSAKIILGEIKRHKLGLFIALLIFVSVAAGIGFYLSLQKTEAPLIPSRSCRSPIRIALRKRNTWRMA